MERNASYDAETDTKLGRIRDKFQDSVDHHERAHEEAHRCSRFYHNTNLEGQWESEDLEYLRDQGRPAFSFNVIKPKINTFLGMYADSQRMPSVVASGDEDRLLAEVIDIVANQTLEDARHERHMARQLKTGTIAGECALHIETEASTKGRGWVQVNLYRILPYELHWDVSSVEPDRSDARHVFWDRWLSKSEFKEAYPDHADSWSRLNKLDDVGASDDGGWGYGEQDIESGLFGNDQYDRHTNSRYYFDRHKRKIRVIRYEYKEHVDMLYAVNEETGERVQQIEQSDVEKLEYAREMLGSPIIVEKSREQIVKVCEFIGDTILREYDTAGPFEGFSIVPYSYAIDEETGTSYSFVRDLIDPQMELNKAKSLDVEHMAQRVTTGAIAEEGSVVDEQQFSDALRQPAGIAMAKKGSLTEARIQLTQPQPADVAAAQRAQSATDLLTEISGIASSAVFSPAEQAQAGMTVALRYNKERQSVQDSFGNFEDSQREVFRRIVEIIVRAMPDDQIAAILADDGRFQVGGGYVVEMVDDPSGSGQKVPMDRAHLRNIRDLNWNLELEHTSTNSTLRMVEFDAILQLLNAGLSVDPELAIDVAFESRAKRDQAKKYVREQEAANAEQSENEAQMFMQQQRQAIQIQAQSEAEKARHNRVEEHLKSGKQASDAMVDALQLFIDADENEKSMILERLKLASQPQIAARG